MTFPMHNLLSQPGVLRSLGPLLAQSEGFQHMSKRFQRGGAAFDWKEAAIAAMLILGPIVLILVLATVQRWRSQRRRHSPQALFAELCRAHGLDRSDRRVLRRVARRLQLPQPSLLFLDAQLLDGGGANAETGARQEDLTRIRQRLFGSAHQPNA